MKKFVFSVASRATGWLQIKPSGSGDENGIEGTLRRARDIVYWPGITAQLKDYLSKCGISATVTGPNNVESL